MSTNPTTTEPTTRTEITARGRADPWSAGSGTDAADRRSPAQRSQRQFDPTARSRLRNLVDSENAYLDSSE